jgi:ABC-2 type transport system permease protein
MFWTFVFPLCLGTFFYLGFGNLSNDNILSTVDVYIASESKEEQLVNQMKVIYISEDEPLFQVNTEYSQDQLENKLNDNEIIGYIYTKDGEIIYKIAENGLKQTITKSFLDSYIQVNDLILSVSTSDPSKLPVVLADLSNPGDYLEVAKSGTNPKANNFIIYFYALIAMACMFASYWGMGLVNDIQADVSPLAARVSVTPTHKLKLIVLYALAALTLHFIGNLGLIVYLRFVLNVEFANNIGLIILASFVGTISGITLGAFLSSIIRGSINKKEGMITTISMVLSFLSGLMNVDVKYLVTKNAPILGYLNPANLLTEAFYSLYYYSDLGKYFFNLLLLSILSVIMIIVTFLRIRGNKYDSI